MSKDTLLLSYNNPISSQHVRELILESTKRVGTCIYTIATSQLIIRECLALGITPVIIPSINDVSCTDVEIYIFYKGNNETLNEYKSTIERLGGKCTIVTTF